MLGQGAVGELALGQLGYHLQTVTASDTVTLTLSETAELTVDIALTDDITLALSESPSIVATLDADDDLELSFEDRLYLTVWGIAKSARVTIGAGGADVSLRASRPLASVASGGGSASVKGGKSLATIKAGSVRYTIGS